MDINQLLAREQVAIMRSNVADRGVNRDRQEGVATHYGALLAASAYPHRPHRQWRNP